MGFLKTVLGALSGSIIALVLPRRLWAKLLLKSDLIQAGVEVGQIPNACLQELSDSAIELAKFFAQISDRKVRTTDIIEHIGAQVDAVAVHLHGNKEELHRLGLLSSSPDTRAPTEEVLRKYKLIR